MWFLIFFVTNFFGQSLHLNLEESQVKSMESVTKMHCSSTSDVYRLSIARVSHLKLMRNILISVRFCSKIIKFKSSDSSKFCCLNVINIDWMPSHIILAPYLPDQTKSPFNYSSNRSTFPCTLKPSQICFRICENK
jgi:hypothetical protein